jgi:hypothetical protein
VDLVELGAMEDTRLKRISRRWNDSSRDRRGTARPWTATPPRSCAGSCDGQPRLQPTEQE